VSWLVVSVHDVAPATAAACRAWASDLDRLGVPASLLVIPGPWRGPSILRDADTAAWLRRRLEAGDEVVQHGWVHDRVPGGARWRQAMGTVVARGCAEFVALDEENAARRLRRGREVFDRLGMAVDGFTPPGWLASPGSLRALRRLGFRYTTSHVGIHPLPAGRDVRGVRVVRAPALSHRPGGRGERVAADLLVRVSRRAAAAGRGVRIALHPADRSRPGLVEATLDAIAEVLALGAVPRTYGAVVAAAAAAGAVGPAAA
jgi:predicted deacetylase